MIIEKSSSTLMQIQPTILRFTKMLSSVLQLEVEIIDANMTRVSGTGPYGKFFGRTLNGNSRLLKHVLETHEEKVVIQSQSDPLCIDCSVRENCQEKAFLGIPIIVQDTCIGVISLVAFTAEQQQRLKENIQVFSDYIRHISTIFVAKLLDSQGNNIEGLNKIFLTLITNMDQGVIVLDDENQVKFINQNALQQLHTTQNKITGKNISIRPLTFQQNYSGGHLQHIVSFDERQELIIGQMHDVHNHQLFLMAFHQSHTTLSEDYNPDEPQIDQLIGECKPIRVLKRLITRVAPSPSSVLIVGESGTGKEVVARAIHRLSDRNDKPFIAINCAAIPDQLLESELFGYVKGAFTGASTNGKIGLIQSASSGTLFLDEIGDMPLTLQAKLLRAIESREVLPIGSSKPVAVDIRIISATNQNFEQYIAEGKFREDLYYRLNVIPISLPPLRERQGDIELLVHFFLNLHTKRIGSVYPGVSSEVIAQLKQYRWPGNVRELSNLMEYLINIVPSGEVIDSSLLPPNFLAASITPVYVQPPAEETSELEDARCATNLESMEKQLIEEALKRNANKKQVAKELGIGVATLYRKIKKYELTYWS